MLEDIKQQLEQIPIKDFYGLEGRRLRHKLLKQIVKRLYLNELFSIRCCERIPYFMIDSVEEDREFVTMLVEGFCFVCRKSRGIYITLEKSTGEVTLI
jgi:hypothetical protein